MSDSVLQRLRDERDQARDAAIAMAESESFDPTAEAFTGLQARAESLDGQIERLTALLSQRQAADALDSRLSKTQKRQGQTSDVATRESWGEVFVRSEAYTGYPGRGTSPRLEIESDSRQVRALPMTLGSWADALPQPTRILLQDPMAASPMLSVISSVEVSGNSVEFIAYRKVMGGADVVPEGELKPPVEWAPEVTNAALSVIAAFTRLTRQLLEDSVAIRSMADTELRREVRLKEESLAAAALAAATLEAATGPDLLSAIRVGVGMVQAAGYTPNAVLLNPADYAALDLSVLGSTLLGPVVGQAFWGLTPIPSVTQPVGTATVGDFAAGITRFYRNGVSLYISDSAGAEDFLRNIFTLLAETRSLTVVTRPAALVNCSAVATPSLPKAK